MNFLNKRRAECREFQMQLEDAAGAAPSAKELSELLAAAPAALKEHTFACVRIAAPPPKTFLRRAPSWRNCRRMPPRLGRGLLPA